MGTWSTGSFGNDAATDFLSELQGVDDMSVIETTIEGVREGGAGADASDAAACIAACEVLAAVLNEPGEAYEQSSEAIAWVGDFSGDVEPALVQAAVEALVIILGPDSELQQQWEESDELKVWLRDVNDLRSRLESV